MPKGSNHTETGRLYEQNGERVLCRDEGGRWRLEMGLFANWRSRKLIGRRVLVVGERDGFDLLAVKRIEPV